MSAIDKHRQDLSETKEARKQLIIETAEKLFIEQGLSNVCIQDIVKATDISRVTFYRYFPDIHPLTMEVAGRMMGKMYKRIIEDHDWLANPPNFQGKGVAIGFFGAMVDSFHNIVEPLRYIGMFDHLYAQQYPNDELAAFYQDALNRGFEASGFRKVFKGCFPNESDIKFFFAVGNVVLAALEKLAARGELLANEQHVSVDYQLDLIRGLLEAYDVSAH